MSERQRIYEWARNFCSVAKSPPRAGFHRVFLGSLHLHKNNEFGRDSATYAMDVPLDVLKAFRDELSETIDSVEAEQ